MYLSVLLVLQAICFILGVQQEIEGVWLVLRSVGTSSRSPDGPDVPKLCRVSQRKFDLSRTVLEACM